MLGLMGDGMTSSYLAPCWRDLSYVLQRKLHSSTDSFGEEAVGVVKVSCPLLSIQAAFSLTAYL